MWFHLSHVLVLRLHGRGAFNVVILTPETVGVRLWYTEEGRTAFFKSCWLTHKVCDACLCASLSTLPGHKSVQRDAFDGIKRRQVGTTGAKVHPLVRPFCVC